LGTLPGFKSLLASGHSVRVMMFEPLPGKKYSRADAGHMKNKIYPDAASAMKRQPHQGFKAKLVEKELSCTQPVTVQEFFGGRKDIDFRVASDMKRLKQFSHS